MTFDDLPAHSALPAGETRVGIVVRILAAVKAAGAPVFGFVNGGLMEREPASRPVLRIWRESGGRLGNHTYSHLALSRVGADAFEADVVRNEPVLAAAAAGEDWRWLRYPYLDEGATPPARDSVRDFLAARGYRIASVTLSFDDYAWNEPYARCVAKGDQGAIAGLEKSYLAAADASLTYARAMSQALYGRDIPYVLLMHEGAFDARMLPRLFSLYQGRGARFVTLETAERDPFYARDRRPAPGAPVTLESAMAARHLTPPAKGWSLASLEEVCR
jgi:peptidoglycan/xylan/chitin deacetylase (PgdA/CDA1 family)